MRLGRDLAALTFVTLVEGAETIENVDRCRALGRRRYERPGAAAYYPPISASPHR